MKTLFVCPHMDDESISCGGLIQKRLAAGGEVQVLALHGRYYGPVDARTQLESDHEEREDFLRALKTLGVAGGFTLMFFEEGEPARVGFYDLLESIEERLAAFQPDEVVIPSGDDLNQDHRRVHHVCEIALRPVNIGRVKKVLAFHALDGRLRQPDYFVTLTRGQLDVKLTAINCYRRERRGLPSPRAPENVEAQARVWGAACGGQFAEGYTTHLTREL